MTLSRQIILLMCISFFSLSANQNNKEIVDAQLKKANNLSPELIMYFLKEGSEVIDLIEKIDPAVQRKIGVLCKGCQKHVLLCVDLAGRLCAQGDQKNLDELKRLLAKKNVQEINNFVLTVVTKKMIECVFCEKFVQWIPLIQ